MTPFFVRTDPLLYHKFENRYGNFSAMILFYSLCPPGNLFNFIKKGRNAKLVFVLQLVVIINEPLYIFSLYIFDYQILIADFYFFW